MLAGLRVYLTAWVYVRWNSLNLSFSLLTVNGHSHKSIYFFYLCFMPYIRIYNSHDGHQHYDGDKLASARAKASTTRSFLTGLSNDGRRGSWRKLGLNSQRPRLCEIPVSIYLAVYMTVCLWPEVCVNVKEELSLYITTIVTALIAGKLDSKVICA